MLGQRRGDGLGLLLGELLTVQRARQGDAVGGELDVTRGDAVALGHHHRARQDVLELPHVPRPGAARELGERRARQLGHRTVHARGGPANQVVDEQGEILGALAQRGQPHGDAADAVVEILAKAALGDLGRQVTVGRAHEAHVDGLCPVRPQRSHLALLEDPEQLHLHRQRHLPELVEQQGAASRLHEQAVPARARAGERAAGGAEQLGLEERLRHRGAVDGNEGTAAASAILVDGLRDELLAGAALALDEDGQVRLDDAIQQVEDPLEGGARADDRAVVVAMAVARPVAERRLGQALHLGFPLAQELLDPLGLGQ